MISASTPFTLPEKAQNGLVEYLKAARASQSKIYNLREHFRSIDLAYARQQDLTEDQWRAKVANKYGDATKFQNITTPIVSPQVEAAVTYQSSVFLTGNPLFGVVAAPELMDVAMQMETVIDSQAVRGGWATEFMQIFRDAFKYNFYALQADWQNIRVANLETDISFSTSEAKPKQTIWAGNVCRRLDPYNAIFDQRVAPHQIHAKGEFAGFTEIMSRIELKAFFAGLDGKIKANVVKAFESGLGGTTISKDSATATYYIPPINPDINFATNSAAGDFDWFKWLGMTDAGSSTINYKNAYQVTTLYAKILPTDFDLKVSERNTPQVWKLIYINDSVLVLAERQTNAHNFLPILFGQGNLDGLGYQTASLASNVTPLQQLSSALWNSTIATQRRSISDRVLYDPSRVTKEHINSTNPAAKIPVRPAAYGKPLGEAVFAFPFRADNLDSIVGLSDRVEAMANKLTRQNPVRQGQFVKGNKTRSEFEQVMGNANGEDQMYAMQFESILFTPLKEILKINILQYQGQDELLNINQGKMVPIDPIQLRTTVMQFKVSDGLLPSDKIMSVDVLREALQTIANVPAIGAGYNLVPMFSYLMKLQGGKINSFEKPPEQIAYEQAVSQWQQLVLQMVKENKDMPPKDFPPQPLPEQFGYNPQQPSPAQGASDDNTPAV